MIHACLKNNTVDKIVDILTEDEYFELSKVFSSVINIENEIIRPNVGWVLNGTSWEEGDIEPSSIKSITPRQFRQAFIVLGHSLQNVELFIDQLPEPQKSFAKIEWEYSTMFFRDNAMLNQMAPLLGYTSEQIDQVFITGASL